MNSLRQTLTALALAVALIGGPALTALAQDEPPDCRGLSAADCALLRNATATTQSLASFNVPAWTINLYLSAEQETVFSEASGTAAVSLPEEVTLLRDTFLSVETVTPDTIVAFLGQLDADRIQTILNELLLSFTVDSLELEAPDGTTAARGALVVKDGTLYLNLPAPSGENAWFGQTMTLTDADFDEIDGALDELRATFDAPQMDEAFDAAGSLIPLQLSIAGLAQQHVATTRLADETLNGQSVAVFSSSFNIKDLLSDPGLAPALLTMLETLAAQDPEMGPVETNEAQLTLLLTALNLITAEGNFTSSQWIGLSDGYLHRLTLDARLNLDPALLATASEEPTPPVVLDISAAADFADFNTLTPAQVTAPSTYYPGDDLENFLVGTPGQVEAVLTVGDVIDRTMPPDGDTHIFALPLEAGQEITLTLESDGYPSLSVYGPDAFLMERWSPYAAERLAFTAESAGVHFITVEGYSDLDYRLTIAAG